MKKILYIAIFISAFTIGSCHFATAQVQISQETANDLYKAVEERNELRHLTKAQSELIAAKDKVIAELQSAKLTPCVISIYSFTDGMNKLPMPASDNSKALNKEIIRNRKTLHDIWKKAIQAQCNYKDNPKWWSYVIQYAPLALVLLKQ